MPRQLAGNRLKVYLLLSFALAVYLLAHSVDAHPEARSGKPEWFKDWPRPDPEKMDAAIAILQEIDMLFRRDGPSDLSALHEKMTALHASLPTNPGHDAVWLRENPDPAFLPVLIRLLKARRRTGASDQFYAAQALFALGLPEGLDAIAEAVGETPSGYFVLHALNGTPGFGMDPVQANETDKRFHLTHASKAFDLSVVASRTVRTVVWEDGRQAVFRSLSTSYPI
jgi:hypothetical protein